MGWVGAFDGDDPDFSEDAYVSHLWEGGIAEYTVVRDTHFDGMGTIHILVVNIMLVEGRGQSLDQGRILNNKIPLTEESHGKYVVQPNQLSFTPVKTGSS